MNPQLPPLIDLQALDLRITELKELQRKTPELIQAAEAPLREVARLLAEAKVSLEALLKERRDRERDLEAQEAHIEKLKARQSELKTNKEYQAHLFELELANKKKGEIEESILLSMERIEAKQQEVKQTQARVAEAERLFGQEKSRLETLAANQVKELVELEEKQRTVAATVDKDLLARYTKLKTIRKDMALAPVRDGICFGCRLQLPPQLVAAVKRSDELQTCSYCHRILYWEGDPVSASADIAQPVEEEDDIQETV